MKWTKVPFQPRLSLQSHRVPLVSQGKNCKGLGNTLMEKLIRKVSTKEQTRGSCKHQYISGHCLQNLVWIPEKKRNRKDSPVLPKHPLQEQQSDPLTTVNKIWKLSLQTKSVKMDTREKDYTSNKIQENIKRHTLCSKLGTFQDTPLSTKGRAHRNFKIMQNPGASMAP